MVWVRRANEGAVGESDGEDGTPGADPEDRGEEERQQQPREGDGDVDDPGDQAPQATGEDDGG